MDNIIINCYNLCIYINFLFLKYFIIKEFFMKRLNNIMVKKVKAKIQK